MESRSWRRQVSDLRQAGPPADTTFIVEYEWVFQRGRQQVIVQRWRRPDKVWELTLIWPTGEVETEGYVDMSALVALHMRLERELVRSGWVLHEFRPERRKLNRRRKPRPRSAAMDRRRFGRLAALRKVVRQR
jgi:hypothetical protein